MTLASVFTDDISANLNFIQSVLTVDCSVNDIAIFFSTPFFFSFFVTFFVYLWNTSSHICAPKYP